MSLKKYLIFMGLNTLICWLAWFLVVILIDPETGGIVGLFLFYISLFLALMGTFSTLGFLIRYWLFKKDNKMIFHQVGLALRHAILFATLITGSLILQSQQLLTWWNALIFVLLLIVIETIFVMKQSEENSHGR